MKNDEILDGDVESSKNRRRNLLPIWIKIWLWIFLVLSLIVPIGLLAGFLDALFPISLYGIETNEPLTLIGIALMLLYGFKGVVALNMWVEKKQAIQLAIIDAYVGIAICVFVVIVLPLIQFQDELHLNFRLELVALILYLIKMKKIKTEWEDRK
jgi:hypothetical protein